MVRSESCTLCLTSESKWFVDVFCEDNQSKDIALIISKHLWFDLKPCEECYVCADCWKSVHDFDLFYCKLEKIHREVVNTLPSGTAQNIGQPDFEFQEIHEVKIEPPEGTENEDEAANDSHGEPSAAQQNTGDEQDDNETFTDTEKERRPRRSRSNPVKYKSESSNSEWDEKDFLAPDIQYDDDEPDDHDDDDVDDDDDEIDDDGFINHDILNSKKTDAVAQETAAGVKNEAAVREEPDATPVPPKRGRGRPPKRRPDENVPSTSNTDRPKQLDHRAKGKRGRKRMKSIASSDSDTEYGSDYEDTMKVNKNKKKPQCKRQARDAKIFSYIDEFFCYYCPDKVLFQRFHHANLHYKELHDEPAFLRCPRCGKKCFTPGGFLSHMETHEDPDKNKCPICGKVTDQKITLKKHMRAHQVKLEGALPYPCQQCPRRFEQEKVRDKHERLHGRKIVIRKEKGRDLEVLAFYKRISCDVCEETGPGSTSFDNFWDLKVHMGNAHNKNPYLKCPQCFVKLACRQQLLVHIDVHNNPHNYRCEVCGEVHQNLEKHMIKAHTPETAIPNDEKNYSCEHCGKMFKCETNLRNHIDRCHGVKDVSCNVCNKSFSRKALGAHKRSAHSDEMFMCEHCPKMFKTRSGLESHKGEHDANLRRSVKCTLCDKEMRRGASMAKHMKTIHSQEDPVNCNLCGKVFRTSFHMMRHRANTCAATINSRPYKCEVCGKGFAMKLTMTEHMTTHTRTSLYQCAFCFKTFGYISNLYKHRKKAHPLEWQEVQARPEDGIATVIEIRN
ncbi:zinc finger protein 85-like [Anopheles cruzii]|uniref:zinc finger protein 85-like n=1 Tax=Anopheles cruzii TaxID=68878 RepID=UPI0022EC6981|nr:zinc finger protein 85-like [Anopheles cruzii]